MRLLRLTRRVFEYLSHLSAFWPTHVRLCRSQFPDNPSSFASIISHKYHGNGLGEHTSTHNIAHPVNEVIG